MSLCNVLMEVGGCCFPRFKHDVVRRVTELHLSTKFCVCQYLGSSELHELNQNKKKNSEIANLRPFLGI